MGMIRRYELPWPPSVNHYWRHVRGRFYIAQDGQRFRQRVEAIVAVDRQKPMDGPLSVAIAAFPPDRRRRDIDNILKALFDALEHAGAYHNDNQIVELHVCKLEPVEVGRVLVTIRESE